MAVYKIADLTAEYSCRFDLLKSRSKKYICDEKEAQIKLSLGEDYYISRRNKFPTLTDEEIEYIGMGAAFYKELLNFDGMMLHASAVELNGEAYLFSAPSGTGKSTHTEGWLRVFENAEIINDDKPAIRKVNGQYFAFGTPFSGKNDISINKGYPIKGICFLDRGKNRIEKLNTQSAMSPLFNQTIRPDDESKMDLLCSRAEDVLESINFYAMFCDTSDEAVKMAYDKMK
ncbi:MAG: hypothetical protein IJZ88_07440 [Clostridia bacterium]|nr:hypothetical protein [Clostridia bacterium]